VSTIDDYGFLLSRVCRRAPYVRIDRDRPTETTRNGKTASAPATSFLADVRGRNETIREHVFIRTRAAP